MKIAFPYIRISTKEQSNFSVDGQMNIVKTYAESRKWIIEKWYIDNGESGKDFNRPSWIRLMKEIEKRSKRDDCVLLVIKSDRLGRNVVEVMKVTTQLEKWGVSIVSVLEPMGGLHHKSPHYFKWRMQSYLDAEFELKLIKDRTSFGIRQARLEGRPTGRCNFGFKIGRDESKKPIWVPDWPKLDIIGELIDNFLMGLDQKLIMQIARRRGLPHKGNSAMERLLVVPWYYELSYVPAYLDYPEQYVKSAFPGIRTEKEFWQIQEILKSRKRQPNTKLNDEFYLRGVIRCKKCGKLLTGAKSTGKSGTRHP